MRVNGQINKVKQLLVWAILEWVTIWQPHVFSAWQKSSANLPAGFELPKCNTWDKAYFVEDGVDFVPYTASSLPGVPQCLWIKHNLFQISFFFLFFCEFSERTLPAVSGTNILSRLLILCSR